MRHRISGRRLNRTSSHRNAMMRNMVTSLVMHERINTTDQKAKELRIIAEKLVTLAKKGDLHARRQALKVVRSVDAMKKLFDEYAVRFSQRAGGYTRIIKTGFRHGDNAKMAIIEYLPVEQKEADKPKKGRKKSAASKKASEKTDKSAAKKAAPKKKAEKKKVEEAREAVAQKAPEELDSTEVSESTEIIEAEAEETPEPVAEEQKAEAEETGPDNEEEPKE